MKNAHQGSSSRVLLLLVALAAACDSKSNGNTQTPGVTSKLQLERVEFGRLVDVYGLRVTAEGTIIELHERDVVICGNIEDQRAAGSTVSDDAIEYDFLSADPDTLQPRLLIPRAIPSPAFRLAFDRLDDALREVTAMRTGQGGPGQPYSVVPRNAAIRLRFTNELPVGDEFFVKRDANGLVTGLLNTEAVQLLKIVGGGSTPNAFVPLPVRVLSKGNTLVLDPVLLGSEGVQYQTVNNAAGLPASPDQLGANIRIALALDGPLALPTLRPSSNDLTGSNNSQRESVVRDFRSGNADDSSSDLARGFVRDTLPLRLVGEIGMFLERVDSVNATTQEVMVWKNGITHEIDLGDGMRFLSASGNELLGSSEVVIDPSDDRDSPATQHVRLRIRRIPGLEARDPRRLPGYPSSANELEPWLLANAPRAYCLAEFTAGAENGRDDPRNFLVFSPSPLPLNGVQPAPNEFVSPFAEALVRFTKPVDLATVRWADTFFFALRDLTTDAGIEQFIRERPNGTATPGMNPAAFDLAKFRAPFLITARVRDEDGSQTSLRLQPTTGFFLSDALRNPAPGADYRYFLHMIADSPDGGIRDLAGNRLDLQGTTPSRANNVVIPFTVDTRLNAGEPMFRGNIVVSLVRRYESRDEDANPSYFLPNEVSPADGSQRAAAYPLEDLFGGFVYVDGQLLARPTSRTRVIADNLNQSPVVQQPPASQPQAPLAWCPQTVFDINPNQTELQRGSNSASNLLNQGVQNPLNPFGCRLQMLWREIDLSLSRTDPFDFNLDIEQMYWAPFTATNLQFDEFDRVSLWLGHSEFRPAPCVGDFSALPSLPDSGLRLQFERNFAWNPAPSGNGTTLQSQSPRDAAYIDAQMAINPSQVVREPNGINRYLPLPQFRAPHFVYRDETVIEQGGNAGIGSDLTALPGTPGPNSYAPYVLSPFPNGQGRRWIDVANAGGSTATFVSSYWNDAPNFRIGALASQDQFTGGLMGSVALPLLADFWTYCDSSELPHGDPYIALGTNGWQVAITVQSNARPNFRVLSAGRPSAAPQGGLCMSTSSPAWSSAAGGWQPGTTTSASWAPTVNGDNTFYWVMLDVVKRQSVITAGFVDLFNPHRVPEGFADARLGPFYLQNGNASLPADVLPRFSYEFDPPLSRLPAGTSLVPQFRAASIVDPTPWYWNAWIANPNVLFPAATAQNPLFSAPARQDLRPSAANFPLDPYKAGDAHIRKWDTRNGRNTWAYLYNRTVTRYVEDPNELMNPAFIDGYSVSNDPFTPRDVRYVNWRFITGNNVESDPSIAPSIDSFAMSYRFTPQ